MGFAAEIKEFLGAAKESWKLMSDTEKTNATNRYTIAKAIETEKENNDPLNKKLKEAKLAAALGENAERGKGNALEQQVLDFIKGQREKGDPAAANAQRATSNYPPASIVKQEPTYDPSHGPLPPPLAQNMRKGGLVQKFAIGGMVEDEDLADDQLPAEAIPTAGTLPPGGLPRPAAPATPAIGGVPTPQPRPKAANPALQPVIDGLEYGYRQVPPELAALTAAAGAGGRRSSRARALLALAQGAGAAPGSDMMAIYKKIDPDGTMPESERSLRALQAVHDYKMKDDPEGAAKTAFQMLQNFRTIQTRYGALAAAALKGGHVEEGVQFALKQYHNIPDGNNLQMWVDKDSKRINWKLDGPDGKPISGGVATPEEIGASAMKLASPGGYENHLVQMASGAKMAGPTVAAEGRKTKAAEAAKAAAASDGEGEGMKAGEYKGLEGSVKSHVENWQKEYEASDDFKKNGSVKMSPDQLKSTKDMLFHVRSNNKVTNNEGMKLIEKYIKAPALIPEGGKPAFDLVKNDEDKTVTLSFDNGGELTLPQDIYRSTFAAARGQRLQDLDKEKNKPKDKGYGEMAGDAASALAEGVKGKAATVFGPAIEAAKKGGFTPETYGEAIPTAGRAINELTPVGWIKPGLEALGKKLPQNPGDVPPIDDPYSLK